MNPPRKDKIGKWRKIAFFLSITAMLCGLLFSRALLSSGLIFFIALSLVHKNILQQLRAFVLFPFLLSMSLLFVLPAVSGIWSEDLSQWSQILRIKLPLLLLPVCFAGQKNVLFKDWQRVSYIFLLLVFAGIGSSVWRYLQNVNGINEAYLKAYTLETPLGNDHVRFSLLVVISILTTVFLLAGHWKDFKKTVKGLLLTLAVIHIIYLHVLAVRTGLICFYLGVFILLMWLLVHHKRNFFLLIPIFFLPGIAYFTFPTFKNKIHYLKYDLSFVRKNIYLAGSSDGNRVASMRAGWELLRGSPFLGVGFGDIKNENNKFYDANFPTMSDNDKILPSSEWIIYGSGAGWPGVVAFFVVMLVPFLVRGLRKNIYWILLNVLFSFSYLFDIGLEVQYGVFLHAFVLLWWYKWLQLKE